MHIMDEKRFKCIEFWFGQHEKAFLCLKLAAKVLTGLMYAFYALLCIYSALYEKEKLLKVIAVPAFVFVSGSLIRKAINAPRPYEVMPIKPLIPKSTKGHSFPSRHVFCAAVIACTCLYFSLPLGILFWGLTLIIGLTRILLGIHWPKDVLAAILYGGVVGMIGFFLI